MNEVKECSLHFGFDKVLNFPEYLIGNTMIIGREYIVSNLITNIISEITLRNTADDILLSVWDTDRAFYDYKTPEDLSKIDIVKLAGNKESCKLCNFISKMSEFDTNRRYMWHSVKCSDIYEFEHKYHEHVPTYVIMINNWEVGISGLELHEKVTFYNTLEKLLRKSSDNKICIILTSSGTEKLTRDMQNLFQYTICDKSYAHMCGYVDLDIVPDLYADNSIAVINAGHRYDILQVPDFYSNIKDILLGKLYPAGVTFRRRRLAELSKLYNMEGLAQ